ncbi:MAG: site-specific DNA-methyltransferase [Muribaculaceae bacterium]|nr:site-specific DNA-methyltransferase [Muribaculaceae bacterium]
MNPEKLSLQSADGAQINLDMLYQIAPSCFTEARGADGKVQRMVNFDVLRQLLGDAAVDTGEEFYQFTWPGKAEARREAARTIRKTLRPVPEDSVDWDTTQNLYIEGDNLEVLKLLQKSYMGKVKMIYIDPPYNTGNDFVYNDDFAATAADHDRAEGNTDELGNRYRKNTDSNGRFHSDWCSMIYPRLLLARNLLLEDGVIFISMDDNEVKNLKAICDEIFGSQNFLAQVVWERAFSPINLMKHFSPSHDYVLCYAKNIEIAFCNGIGRTQEANERYSNPDNDPRGVWSSSDISVGPAVETNIYPIRTPSGRIVEPPAGRSWSLSANAFAERLQDNRIWFGPDGDGVPRIKRFLSELRKTGITPMTIWKHTDVGHSQDATQKLAKLFDGKKYFDYPKPVDLIKRCLELYTTKDCIVLDFFSGSGTTAHSLFKLNAEDDGNRRFILVQLPEPTEEGSEARKAGYENICEIGKERIRRAGRKIKEEAGLEGQDLDIGFRVFRVDESNMEDVYFQPAALSQDKLDLLLDNVKPDRTDLDLLFGAMLDWGVQLSLPMSKSNIDGCDVYTVNEGDLVSCFAENITENVIAHIADQSPLRVLFRDSCFKTDANKINIFEQFKQRLGWSDKDAMKNIRVI